MILLIDNYDSFTYNLVQYLGEMNVEMQVHRNDQISIEQIRALKPERILVSPGPCSLHSFLSKSFRLFAITLLAERRILRLDR